MNRSSQPPPTTHRVPNDLVKIRPDDSRTPPYRGGKRMACYMRIALAFLLLGSVGHARGDAPIEQRSETRARPVNFAREVRPILSDNCFACHGPDDQKRKAGLRLDTREGAFSKLESGDAAIVPGKPDESELINRIEN